MTVEEFIKKVAAIEIDLKNISQMDVVKASDGIMVGALGAFVALCIAENEWPRWFSFTGLVALMGKCFHVYYKWRRAKSEYKAVCKKIAADLTGLRKACQDLEESIRVETEKEYETTTDSDGVLPKNITSIVKPLQRLENSASQFKDERIHEEVREEADRVLRAYRLEFLDYTEETQECYDIEEAEIDKISYASLAVVKKNRSMDDGESSVILRGKVFIPKK